MKEVLITENESGQRFDKFLEKFLPGAGKSFLYKMMRKKNIILNGKKANGNEMLCPGDSIKVYFSDETFEKFAYKKIVDAPLIDLDIIYEDKDVVFINKPYNMLSQKASQNDISLCEYLIAYLKANNSLSDEDLRAFTPSVCNRLDRNTSGLITAGKSLKGLQMLSNAFKERLVDKYYIAIVHGEFKEDKSVSGYLVKDKSSNMVKIIKDKVQEAEFVSTKISPLEVVSSYSLVKVKLLTGKTHQIRATLSSIGFPIVGDKKYGITDSVKRQMLHSYELFINGNTYKAIPPDDFTDELKKLGFKYKV